MPGKTRNVARFPNRRGMDWEPEKEEGIQQRECVIVMLRARHGNVSLEGTERDERAQPTTAMDVAQPEVVSLLKNVCGSCSCCFNSILRFSDMDFVDAWVLSQRQKVEHGRWRERSGPYN